MGAVYFYHLTSSTLEQTLPMLLGKSREAGWVIEVRGTEAGAMARLDAALWQGPPDSFAAHGLAGGPQDADQPVLLTTQAPDLGAAPSAANNPTALMAVHGAPVTPEEVAALQRVAILFDGNDSAAVERARAQWKTLTAAGCAAQYWAQDEGRWAKKADANT